MREAEIEKTKFFQKQNLATGLSKYRKIKALSRFSFSGKIWLLYALFWLFFAKKEGRGYTLTDWNQNLTYPIAVS